MSANNDNDLEVMSNYLIKETKKVNVAPKDDKLIKILDCAKEILNKKIKLEDSYIIYNGEKISDGHQRKLLLKFYYIYKLKEGIKALNNSAMKNKKSELIKLLTSDNWEDIGYEFSARSIFINKGWEVKNSTEDTEFTASRNKDVFTIECKHRNRPFLNGDDATRFIIEAFPQVKKAKNFDCLLMIDWVPEQANYKNNLFNHKIPKNLKAIIFTLTEVKFINKNSLGFRQRCFINFINNEYSSLKQTFDIKDNFQVIKLY